MLEASCSTCRFFEPGDPDGECRRHAPRVQFERNYNIPKKQWLRSAYAIWPLVDLDDWCGEFDRSVEIES